MTISARPLKGRAERATHLVLRLLAGGLFFASLTGCSSMWQAAEQTLSPLWDRSKTDATRQAVLREGYEYLRVDINGHSGLMVRGGEETSGQNRISVWYSADGGVLKLAGGRLVGYSDGQRRWSLLSQDTPDASHTQAVFRETFDAQPGDRYGLSRVRERHPLSTSPRGQRWQGQNALTWVEERDRADDPRYPQPVAWFGIDAEAVPPRFVYGHRCIAPDWCIDWQSWPPRSPNPSGAARAPSSP